MDNMISIENLIKFVEMNSDIKKKSDSEIVDVIDSKGEFIGTAPRFLCHKLGLIHKVVLLLIEDSNGRLLLQKRGDFNKKRYDLPVGGHMNINDNSPFEALCREMKEELGFEIKNEQLEFICKYLRSAENDLKKPKEINNEMRFVFLWKITNSQNIKLLSNFNNRYDKNMVLEINWFELDEIIENCNLSNAADGLASTLPHYLLWKLKNDLPEKID